MTQADSATPKQRLLSLDVFRGITIAGMILVNNPGSWGHIYGPLKHAEWNGWTPTDLVFPFFLFIVGVAMTFSFKRRRELGGSAVPLLGQIVRRTLILFLLGLIMYGFTDPRLVAPYILAIIGLSLLYHSSPHAYVRIAGAVVFTGAVALFAFDFAHFQASELRVPGVLQRIAACYFCASLIMLVSRQRAWLVWATGLIGGYWIIVRCCSAPADYVATVAAPEGLLHDWIDAKLLGAHLYRHRPDPEGILSTMPAVATVLLGGLVGDWLQSSRDQQRKVIGLFFAANIALVLGMWMHHAFPINKKIWTSSYVVFTAGLAMHFLAMCYWLIDVRGYRRWASPFVWFGTNAIAVFVASGMCAVMMSRIKLTTAAGNDLSLKTWIYRNVFVSWAGELNGSLLYALTYVAIWSVLLIPLYRRRIFIKV